LLNKSNFLKNQLVNVNDEPRQLSAKNAKLLNCAKSNWGNAKIRMLEQRIEQDLKTALLAGDSRRISTLRVLKSVLLNVKVASGKRESGLDDDVVIGILNKEAKQRQESADIYITCGDQVRADAELEEKAIIEIYLPAQLSEAEITAIIDKVVSDSGATGQAAMGQVIGLVKQQTHGAANGSVIARLTKERLGL
jgi:uncharacterized protein YqeY